jgi:hypothetical protein
MPTTRREFVKLAAAALAAGETASAGAAPRDAEAASSAANLRFESNFYRVELAADRPTFVSFSVDSLGHGKLDSNVMLPPTAPTHQYHVSRQANTVEYRRGESDEKPAWSFAFTDREIVIRASAPADNIAEPVELAFDHANTHPTLLGLVTDEGNIRLPALLHFPAHGTFRIGGTTRDPVLVYDASRDHGDNFVRVSFPPTTWTWFREIEYRLEVTAIYPHGDGIDDDPRYDGYRRDFLSILQLNPRRRALANNSASDATPITLFEYSMMAARMPPLAEGLTAFDILRQTLERYIGGMTGYGMIGYLLPPRVHYDFLDVYPALVMASADYLRAAGDNGWNTRYYSTLKDWADKILEFDRDGDGLMEYALSGNSGSWPVELSVRPSNWWDTIGFGYKDA